MPMGIMKNAPVRAVIFDKDGTLHDTEASFRIAWRQAAADFCVPDIEQTIIDCTGRNLQDMAVYWAKKYGDKPPFWDYINVRNRYYLDMVAKEVPLRPGAMELLRWLKANGYLVAMATSSPQPLAEDHIRRTGMDGIFDALVTGDMVTNGKPAPEIYLKAAAALGVDPAVCVGVEDAPNGIMAVVHAGMRAVMVPDLIQPDEALTAVLWAKCDRLTDLIPLLEAVREGE